MGVEDARVPQYFIAAQPCPKERFGFWREHDGAVFPGFIKRAALQERKDGAGIGRAIRGLEPGTEVVTVGLQGALKGSLIVVSDSSPHEVGQELHDQV